MDITLLPMFIIGLLALICVLLVMFPVRLDREVCQLKAEVGDGSLRPNAEGRLVGVWHGGRPRLHRGCQSGNRRSGPPDRPQRGGHLVVARPGVLLAALLGLAALAACDDREQAAKEEEKEEETARPAEPRGAHWQDWARESGLGLSFAVPPGRVVKLKDRRVDLSNPAACRTVDVIELYPEGPPPALRVGDGPVLDQGSSPAPFTLREGGSGSGGVQYTLTITRTVEGLSVVLLAILQTEGGVPSFAEAWAVSESLRPADEPARVRPNPDKRP